MRLIQGVLRDIYDSEELKIDLERSKAISKVIDQLCATVDGSSAFSELYELVGKEVEQKKELEKEPAAKRNLFQASYMYLAKGLPIVLKRLGKEQPGSISDPLLWQVRARAACIDVASPVPT